MSRDTDRGQSQGKDQDGRGGRSGGLKAPLGQAIITTENREILY